MGENSRKRKQRHLNRTVVKGQTPTPKFMDIGQQANQFFKRTDLVAGCYDDPEFQALERQAPTILERYALHVLTEGTKRNSDRDVAIKTVAERFAAVLAEMSPAESHGQCMNITVMLIRALEMIGVWCFGATGATSVFTPNGPTDGRHLYASAEPDNASSTPGHSWVVAPPYMVVDCSIYYQGWESSISASMDRLVLSRAPIPEAPDFNNFAAPIYRQDPDAHAQFRQLQRHIWSWLKCSRVELEKSTLHYLPCVITLPLEPGTAYSFGDRPLRSFTDGL